MHGEEHVYVHMYVYDACIWTCAIRIAAYILYKVVGVKGFHRVEYIIYP